MSNHAKHSGKLRERALDEFKAFAVLSLYLYICLGAVILYKSAVLSTVGVDHEIWGIVAVKAMVLAKFMLFARMLHVEHWHQNKPLIWPICNHALVFLVVLLLLTTIEELILGAIHDRPIAVSLARVVGPTLLQGGAACLIMFLILVPYSAFTCLANALGETEVFRLFFVDRSAGGRVRERLTGQVPPAELPH
jgi:hypothetical protein